MIFDQYVTIEMLVCLVWRRDDCDHALPQNKIVGNVTDINLGLHHAPHTTEVPKIHLKFLLDSLLILLSYVEAVGSLETY